MTEDTNEKRLKDIIDTVYKLFPVSISIMTVSGGVLLVLFLRKENAFSLFSAALNSKLFLSLIFFALLWSVYFAIIFGWMFLIGKLRLKVENNYN